MGTNHSRVTVSVKLQYALKQLSNLPAPWLAPQWDYTSSGPLHSHWFYPSGSTLCCFYSFWSLWWVNTHHRDCDKEILTWVASFCSFFYCRYFWTSNRKTLQCEHFTRPAHLFRQLRHNCVKKWKTTKESDGFTL